MAPKIQPANLKFIEWLDEWTHQASEIKNQNMYWVYRKAASSLRKETQPLTCKQLKKLPGIGDTICKKMEAKLKAFLDENGDRNEVYLEGIWPAEDEMPQSQQPSSIPSTSLSLDVQEEPEQPAKKKRNTTNKPYRPQYRSGGYAILMAMQKFKQLRGTDTMLTRTEITDVAQEYCYSSFSAGGQQNMAYTAWNSMATLVKKELVYKSGHPPKYCLTLDGAELAESLWSQTENFEQQQQLPPEERQPLTSPPTTASKTKKTKSAPQSTTPSLKQTQLAISKSSPAIATPHHPSSSVNASAARSSANSSPSQFQFMYVDAHNKQVTNKDQAVIRIDETCSFKIIFNLSQSSHPFSSKVQKENPAGSNLMYGYIDDSDAPERAPGLSKPSVSAQVIIQRSSTLDHKKTFQSQRKSQTRPPLQLIPPPLPSDLPPSSNQDNSSSSSKRKFSDTNSEDAPTKKNDPYLKFSPWPCFPEETPYQLTWTGDPIILPPNSFDIVLLVDSREKRGMNDRQYVQLALERKNILYSTRALDLGDVAWIARSKRPNSSGQHYEVMLDFIIERKRLDDLVSSIKSGRFKEQKTRLSHCSVNCIFYLIEDLIGNASVEAFGDVALRSAFSLLQILDDIHVIRAKSFDDCIEQLLKLHQIVISHYLNKPIYVIPPAQLEKSSFVAMKRSLELRDNRPYHLLYSSFNELNTKSKALTLKDIWLKQLLCIKGLSADKAMKIVERYPTMRSLLVALEKEAYYENKVKLFKNWDPVVSKNNIGDALAKKIVEFFTSTNNYPSPPPSGPPSIAATIA